jgi:hypothetical protein
MKSEFILVRKIGYIRLQFRKPKSKRDCFIVCHGPFQKVMREFEARILLYRHRRTAPLAHELKPSVVSFCVNSAARLRVCNRSDWPLPTFP